MAWTTLIDTGALAARLEDPALAIIDCRYNLDNEAWGAREYRTAHIPGAAYAHLAKADVDLRGATALPEDAVLEVLIARLAGLSRRAGAGGSTPRGRPRQSGPGRSRGRS